nr:hypothetical protein [Tanacetum cinerariifolium]
MLPIELTNEDIRNYVAYKEYYAIASGAAPPKTKESVRKTWSYSDTTITPSTAPSTRLSTLAKGKQPAKSSKAKGLSVLSEVAIIEAKQMKLDTKRSLQQTHISQASGSCAYKGTGSLLGVPDVPTDESDKEISWKSSDEDDDNDEVDDISGKNDMMQRMTMKNCIKTSTSIWKVETFDHRLKTLEANFFEFVQTNQFARAFSSILRIVERYMDQRMNETVKVAVQIQSDRLRDEAQAENEEFLNNPDENLQKIIKEQVKEHVKVHVSKILLKIKKTMNEQLEAEVLTHSFNSSKTSYVVAAGLYEMELKKILIEKMDSNKSIHRSNEQRNLYKALVDAYECDKIILDTYRDTITLKRRRDDADKDEEPSAGSDRGSKRRRKEKSKSQQAHQMKRRPRPLASLLKGPNLIERLYASLHQQRSQCRQLKIWKSPHIKSLKQTYNCWLKLKLLDDAADITLRLLEQSAVVVQIVSAVQIVKTVSIRVNIVTYKLILFYPRLLAPYYSLTDKDLQESKDPQVSFEVEEEPTNYALMAFTSSSSTSSDNNVASCSIACIKAYATLQSHYDKLINDLRKSQFDVLSYKTGLESIEARLLIYQQNETVFEEDIKLLNLDVELRDNALVALRQKYKKAEQERYELRLKLENSMFDCDEMLSSVSDEHLCPPKLVLVFYDALTVNETVHTAFNVELSLTKPDKDLSHRPSALIIEAWVFDSEDESEAEPTQTAPSFI